MVEAFGYYLPWEYAPGQRQEHLATRGRASLCDLGYMGFYTIEGPDAVRYLQQLVTNDIEDLTVGRIRYTAMCNGEGHMMDDGTIWKISPTSLMFVTGDEEDFSWISQNADGYDVNVKNITSEHTTLALQGPCSDKVLSKITAVDLDTIKYYHFKSGKVAGANCLIARMGYTGEFGYELHFHPQHCVEIWKSVMQAGEEFSIVPCGQAALESLRQESGYLLVGNDHDKTTNPFEAGIGWVIKLKKTDFIGKEALTKVLRQGIDRMIVWFRLPGGEVAKKGDRIFSGGHQIGVVTSGSYSPTLEAGTAMGYVEPRYAIASAIYQIESGERRSDAKLSLIPLYDPTNARPKSIKE